MESMTFSVPRANGFVRFDHAIDHPSLILLVTVRKASPSKHEWELTKTEMVHAYDAAERVQAKMSIIFDLSLLGLLNFEYYRDWGELFAAERERTARLVHRTAVVTTNCFVQQAMQWFFQNVYSSVRPMAFVTNVSEGIRFVASE
jgi:hypothetical protein